MRKASFRRSSALAAAVAAFTFGLDAHAVDLQVPLPGDTPAVFEAKTGTFDFVKRVEMVPMRDGAKLKTIILIPKGAANAPMLLTRTPYNAEGRVSRARSPHLAAVVPQMNDTAV